MSLVMEDVGSGIAVVALSPVTAAGTVNGAAFDRAPAGTHKSYMSLMLILKGGAATGTPTAQTADLKLQHSDDGSTGWADYTDRQGNGAVTQITADAATVNETISLAGMKRYGRLVLVTALTAGTSPTWPVAALGILGGSTVVPT